MGFFDRLRGKRDPAQTVVRMGDSAPFEPARSTTDSVIVYGKGTPRKSDGTIYVNYGAGKTTVYGAGSVSVKLRLSDPIDDVLSGRAASPVSRYNDRGEAILRRFRERAG